MNRRSSPVSFALLFALSACATHDEVGESRAAITGGMASDNESVVLVQEAGTGQICSGTLVGSQSVLTMRFCATTDLTSDGRLAALGGFTVGSGASISMLEATAGVTAIAESGTTAMGEVVILQLDAPMPGTPLAPSDALPAVDDEVTILGFGQSSMGGTGIRREGVAVVTGVDMAADNFVMMGPAWFCNGDAGGPVIDGSGRLAGLGYFGAGACGSDTNNARRIDDLVTFIEENSDGPLVVDAGADTGPGDAVVADTGTTGDGATGDGATGDTGTGDTGTGGGADGGGCDCFAARSSAPSLPAALPLAFVVLFLGARRLRLRR